MMNVQATLASIRVVAASSTTHVEDIQMHLQRVRDGLCDHNCNVELDHDVAAKLRDTLIGLSTPYTDREIPLSVEVRKLATKILTEAPILKKYEAHIRNEQNRERKRQKSRSINNGNCDDVDSFMEDEKMRVYEEKKEALMSLSPDALRKMHEESAAAAVKHDYRERFPCRVPLQYLCRRPELRWEWRDKRHMVQRQMLIGGGTNSDLENF